MKIIVSHHSILRTHRRRSGVTLLELVVSIGVSSILIAGMTSSLLLAVEANNLTNGPFQEIESASRVVSQIDRELSYATEIITPLDSPHAVEFRLADQTGDGIAEIVRYQWTGVDKDPLERIFNDETPQILLAEVSQFGVDINSVQKNLLGEATESSEQTWISQTGSFSSSSLNLSKNTGAGTDFVPTLPGDAIGWSISSVDVYCLRNGSVSSNNVIYARVYTTDASRTPDQLIDESIIQEENLSTSYNWHNVAFQNVQNRTPGERLCVTFEGEDNTSQKTYFRVLGWSFFTPETWLIRYSNSSRNWSGSSYDDLAVIIRGKYLTENSVEVNYCQYANVELQTGDQPTSAVRSIVKTQNLPEVTGE